MKSNSKYGETKTDVSSELAEKILQAANKTITFFESKLEIDGSYGKTAKDISCYYKSPMMFIYAGKLDLAKHVLGHIKNVFMLENGDFSTSDTLKSIKPEYIEYWSYVNGWILRAANKLKMTEISNCAYDYLKQFYVGKDAGFLTNNPENKTDMTDVLTTAHHGLINLEREDLDLAIQAGNYLCHAINNQPNIQEEFYLRFDKTGAPIVQFPKDQAPFYFIKKSEPNQLYFMLGYPCAYLALLYQETKDQHFLIAAKEYLDFSLSCHESVYHSNFSHKITWAASILYSITGEDKYLKAIERITNYFIENQSNTGIWYTDQDINTQYDQSAEITCWFLDIAKNLREMKPIKEDSLSYVTWAQSILKTGAKFITTGFWMCCKRRNSACSLEEKDDNKLKLN